MLAVILLLDIFTSGFGQSRSIPESERTAEATYAVTLSSSNRTALLNQGVTVSLSWQTGCDRVVALSAVDNGTHMLDGKTEIYSVRYQGTEYYYNGGAYAADASAAGLYYSDGWKFVLPQNPGSAVELEVQVTYFLNNRSGKSQIPVYDENAVLDGTLSAGSQVVFDTALAQKVSDALNGLEISYYDYAGQTQTASYRSGAAASATEFGYGSLGMVFQEYRANELNYWYDIQYGSHCFTYMNGDSARTLVVYRCAPLSITPRLIPGSNFLKLETNVSDSSNLTRKCYFDEIYMPGSTGIYSTSWKEDGVACNSSSPIQVNSANQTLVGGLSLSEEGIYLPGRTCADGVGYYVKGNFGAAVPGRGAVTEMTKYEWYGPKSSSLGNVELNKEVSLTSGLKDVSGADSSYAGTVIKVNDTSVTASKPYEDDYVKITAEGMVTAKKNSDKALSYTVVTQTKYTKLAGYTEKEDGSILSKTIRFDDGSAQGSDTMAGYGYQQWDVKVTLTPKGAKEEETISPATQKKVAASLGKVTGWKAKQKGKGKIRFTWKKSSKASGYVIYYKTSKKAKFKKYITISKNKTNYTKKVKNKKQTYYFRIRAYRKVSGQKVYGAYSKVFCLKYKKK